MKVILRAIAGPAEGRSFDFDEPNVFIFGRALDAHCPIPSDRAISRQHFMLQVNPPDCVLIDLNSNNGTLVNGVRYGSKELTGAGPVRLKDGDEVVAGQSTFRVGVAYGIECDTCGAGISPDKQTVTVTPDGKRFCEKCTPKAPRNFLDELDAAIAMRPKTGVVGSVCCVRCGRDVVGEAGARALIAGAQYLCRRCRKTEAKGRTPQASGMAGAPRPPALSEHEYVRVIGTGGQGAVYLARHTTDGSAVAVKALLPEVAVTEQNVARFVREIQTTMSLFHDNIVRVLGHGRDGPILYCLMEYVEGTDAEELAKRHEYHVDVDEALEIVKGGLKGLAHAHASRIVHRDLKPANLLLSGTGRPWEVKVADFGLAKSFELAGLSGITVDSIGRGTLTFMPREQVTHFKWLKPSADVYSMAASFFYLVSGRPPKLGLEEAENTVEMAHVIVNEPAVPVRMVRPDVPRPLAFVIDTCLLDDEAKRYPDGAAMLDALNKL